jgi:glycosyltransferase involved in cell wall biosynthesis
MSPPPRLKIAYLCDLSPLQSWTYSGGNARIYAALSRHVGDVTVLSPGWHALEWLRRALHAMPEAINIRARWRLHLLASRIIAAGVVRELALARYDLLFCAYSFHALAGLRLPYPMLRAFTSDATPSSYKGSEIGENFGSYLSVSRLFDPLILRAETRVLQANDLNLWPSVWQKQQADRLYGLSEDQSVLLPWGANIETPAPPKSQPVLAADKPLQLLFVGRDWQAKGGPLVTEVLKSLRTQGVDARLNVVGCVPPEQYLSQPVTVFPSLDKSEPAEAALLAGLYAQSHFLVMPSFEAYGFAFCEASAHGLPSICLRIGGVPVVNGVNGFALPKGAGVSEIAGCIRGFLENPAAYDKLRVSSRAYFESDLNWDRWGQRVADLLRDRVHRISSPSP